MSQPQIGTNGYDQLHKLHLWKQEKMLKFQKQNFKVFENHRKCHIWDFQTSIDSMDKDNYGWTSLIQWTRIIMDELASLAIFNATFSVIFKHCDFVQVQYLTRSSILNAIVVTRTFFAPKVLLWLLSRSNKLSFSGGIFGQDSNSWELDD